MYNIVCSLSIWSEELFGSCLLFTSCYRILMLMRGKCSMNGWFYSYSFAPSLHSDAPQAALWTAYYLAVPLWKRRAQLWVQCTNACCKFNLTWPSFRANHKYWIDHTWVVCLKPYLLNSKVELTPLHAGTSERERDVCKPSRGVGDKERPTKPIKALISFGLSHTGWPIITHSYVIFITSRYKITSSIVLSPQT